MVCALEFSFERVVFVGIIVSDIYGGAHEINQIVDNMIKVWRLHSGLGLQ